MPIDITNKEEKQIALAGTQIEETLLQAHLSKDAIVKIKGLQASASEIDISNEKSLETLVLGKDIELGTLITGFCVIRQNGNLTGQAKYSVTDFIEVLPSSNYQYSGRIGGSPSLCGYDENKNFVEPYVNTNGTEYNGTYPFTTGANVKYVRLSCQNINLNIFNLYADFKSFTSVRENEIIRLAREQVNYTTTYYLAENGSDSNRGSEESPLLTLNKAFELADINDTKIIIKGGTYRQTIDFSKISNLNTSIVTNGYDDVKFMGSEKLKNITKTSGRNFIYQSSMASLVKSAYIGKRLFDMDTKSFPISEIDSLPQQKGADFRLPYTSLVEISDQGSLSLNLDYLDGLKSGGIWHDEVGDIVYIISSDKRDLTSSNIEVPLFPNTIKRTKKQQNSSTLYLNNIDFYFSSEQGVRLDHFNCVESWKSRVFGSAENGWYEGAVNVKHFGCEGANCGRDGFNGHFYEFSGGNLTTSHKSGYAVYSGVWSHDNGDDGLSHHERGSALVDASLSESNGYEGYSQVNGAGVVYTNSIARNNGGIGFHGDHGVDDGRLATQLLYFNCISEGNKKGFENDCSVSGSSTSKLYDCKATNNTEAQYSSTKVNGATTDSNMILVDCKYTGSTPKSETNGGVITVESTTFVI